MYLVVLLLCQTFFYFFTESISFGQPTLSISSAASISSGLAVDGDYTNLMAGGSCWTHDPAHTDYPWWAVDLGDKYVITGVNVQIRGDAGEGNIKHILTC